MKYLLLAIVTIFVTLIATSCSTEKETDLPNVVLIYADDLGRGLLSCEGQKIITTPNIDKLSESGVRFENVYGCMFCAPARASLLTGYHDLQTDKWKISGGGVYKHLSTDSTLSVNSIQNALVTFPRIA